MSTPAADKAQQIDNDTRHEAALVYANGDSRQAINTLIQRVNATSGHCDPRIWIMLLDLYRIHGQQAPYEKLAVFFSNRFNYSPPAWGVFENPSKAKPQQGAGRNALVIEGSPTSIHEEKVRDFIRASREAHSSRIDISRMRIDKNGKNQDDLQTLLDIMQKLRRAKVPTLLMGDTELFQLLKDKTQNPTTDFEQDKIYWFVLFELYQWRGEEEKFDDLVDVFARTYDYCPVGYDPEQSIATTPTQETEDSDEQDDWLEDTIGDPTLMLEHIQRQWDTQPVAHLNFLYVKRMTADAAREVASFLQAQSDDNNPQGHTLRLDHVTEVLAALFEVTGVAAYAQIHHRHAKLLNLLHHQQ